MNLVLFVQSVDRLVGLAVRGMFDPEFCGIFRRLRLGEDWPGWLARDWVVQARRVLARGRLLPFGRLLGLDLSHAGVRIWAGGGSRVSIQTSVVLGCDAFLSSVRSDIPTARAQRINRLFGSEIVSQTLGDMSTFGIIALRWPNGVVDEKYTIRPLLFWRWRLA